MPIPDPHAGDLRRAALAPRAGPQPDRAGGSGGGLPITLFPAPGAAIADGPVSRARFDRERSARREAERLLEAKSRELYEANEALRRQAGELETLVAVRTADLEAARQQAEAANAAKTTFLAAMSHEIRTPLNGVLGVAAALRDTALTQDQVSMIDLILGSGTVLMTVINDILDLSKVEAGRVDIETVPFELQSVLRSVEQTYGLAAREKGLAFGVDASAVGDPWLAGDPTRLRQVLSNLISNAVKFTERGSVAVTISLAPVAHSTLRQDVDRMLVVAVADTGPGIPAEHLCQLFQPFRQAGADIARRYGGTGLGLQLSQQFCRLMGGDLTVQSQPGVGSVFTATLRVARAPAPEPDECRDFRAEFRRFAEARQPVILIADDNATNRAVLRYQLARYPCRLVIAADGREALAAWQNEGIDIALMDVQMPEMDGLQATAAIRAAEAAQGARPVPIVALSANAMRHQAQVYLDAGMNAVVTKPVDLCHLLTTITRLIQGDGHSGERPAAG